ncbi:MAG: gliding motility protein GldB [Tannerella sp.]|jgi:hypothetical protein|nr:gliding motility protein GldB [Tannerella sp.]
MRPFYFILWAGMLVACVGLTGCKKDCDAETPVHIHRFDRDLYRLLQSDHRPDLQDSLAAACAPLLHVIGRSIFRTEDTQTSAFFDRMLNYYAEPTLNRLYSDALNTFADVDGIEDELVACFRRLRTLFPSMQLPAVYMHVSGLQQNVIVADSLLSLSIDKYLGVDYPLYRDYFYGCRLRRMTPEHVVPDGLTAWLLSEYPFRGDERSLLDRMIYEGKIKYVLQLVCPRYTPELGMGYTPEEYRWCRRNEKMLWRRLIEHKHLFTPDAATTAKYFSDAPSAFIADDAPGNLGAWTGWRIVARYMDRTHTSPEALMNENDSQEILRQSKYKP